MTNRKRPLAQLLALSVSAIISGAMTACNSSSSGQRDSGLNPSSSGSTANPATRVRPATISIDLRPYMAAIIAQKTGQNATGQMLCDTRGSKADHCNTSLTTTAGEARLVSSKGGGIDYIAITSFVHKDQPSGSSPYYIGVIRNWTGPASGSILRCFSTPNAPCGSPADSSFMPEGAPYLIPNLPVVGVDALNDATNPSDGSPLKPIAGSMITTLEPSTGNYWNFGINNFNWPTGCAQTSAGTGASQTRIVYVTNVPFGGTIGNSDAIVIDGYSKVTPSSENHVERAFYVLNVGRVRFGIAFYDPSDGLFDSEPHYDAIHSNEETINNDYFNWQGEQCNQGSYITLFPSGGLHTSSAGVK